LTRPAKGENRADLSINDGQNRHQDAPLTSGIWPPTSIFKVGGLHARCNY
jgi:hypothetical protein